MEIRDAVETDLPAICDIYNDAVANTTAIWNEILVDVGNRAAWLKARNAAALSVAGEVVGYASFGEWRAFDGYRHTVEHSVYVRADQRGGGIGKALMLKLIERAEALGKHVMIAGIESGNLPSIRLHEQMGFQQTGHMKEVGTKFGRWLDLTFMQLVLRTGSPT